MAAGGKGNAPSRSLIRDESKPLRCEKKTKRNKKSISNNKKRENILSLEKVVEGTQTKSPAKEGKKKGF